MHKKHDHCSAACLYSFCSTRAQCVAVPQQQSLKACVCLCVAGLVVFILTTLTAVVFINDRYNKNNKIITLFALPHKPNLSLT